MMLGILRPFDLSEKKEARGTSELSISFIRLLSWQQRGGEEKVNGENKCLIWE